jgi:hypothetical protein
MRTTLNKIREHNPCRDGWEKLLRGLSKTQADDDPMWIDTILDHNGLDDALWCLRAVKGCDREIRLYAVWCARRVQHLMVDARRVAALDVVERYARNEASDEEVASAWVASVTARSAAAYAASAASSALAAYAASTYAAVEVEAAARAAARAAGADCDAERAAQAEELRRICREMKESGR